MNKSSKQVLWDDEALLRRYQDQTEPAPDLAWISSVLQTSQNSSQFTSTLIEENPPWKKSSSFVIDSDLYYSKFQFAKELFEFLKSEKWTKQSFDWSSPLTPSSNSKREQDFRQLFISGNSSKNCNHLTRNLINSSAILKSLEAKDFGKVLQFLYVLVRLASERRADQSCQHQTGFGQVVRSSLSRSKNIPSNSTDLQKVFQFMNHANCGTKTTDVLKSNVSAIYYDQRGQKIDQQEVLLRILSVWLLQASVSSVLLKCYAHAIKQIIFCADSVRLLLITSCANQCDILQGDGFKKDSSVFEATKEVTSLASENIQPIVNMALAGAGEMYMGFGQGGMMGEQDDEDVNAPFEGDIGEEFAEIPDFGNYGDDEEEDIDEEFARRMRQGAHGEDAALRRVPSIASLPEVEDFMDDDDLREHGRGRGSLLDGELLCS